GLRAVALPAAVRFLRQRPGAGAESRALFRGPRRRRRADWVPLLGAEGRRARVRARPAAGTDREGARARLLPRRSRIRTRALSTVPRAAVRRSVQRACDQGLR